jgi:hypothetical protein
MTQKTRLQTLKLEIITSDSRLMNELMEGHTEEAGTRVSIGDVGSLALVRHKRSRAWGQPEVIEFALEFATSVAAPVLANWIWQKLKDRKAKIKINGTPLTKIAQRELEQVLQLIEENSDE